MAVQKHQMNCCALCHMTCNDNDSIKDIEALIKKTQEESKQTWTPEDRRSGERAIMVITTPNEKKLVDNLRHLHFSNISNINRRNGYPEGRLKVWILSW